MTAGERFKNWIDGLAESWKDKLRGWVLRSIGEGITKFTEDMEPGAIKAYTSYITEQRDNPHTPQSLKDFYNEILTPGNPFAVFGGIVTMVLGSFGALLGGSVPVGNFMRYEQDALLHSSRLDPAAVITAWRRNPKLFTPFLVDLDEQGWTPERIEAFKEITKAFPPLADVIRFYAREAFEPDMIARYGLDEETPPYEGTLFEKLGVDKPISDLYWIAHWEHASWMQVVEMLRRGILTTDRTMPAPPTTQAGWDTRDAEGMKAMYEWFRLVEIPPFWRGRLTELTWEVPTRVDVRRWWDMRTISEDELRNIYHRQGYHGTDLDNYVKWTKVYTDFPMMMARFSNGWITAEDIRVWLRGLEIPEDRINQFIQEKTKPESPARTAKEKDLTKTEIYKGVKKGLISWSEGIELLMDLGYSEDEADYILAVNVGVLEGSPETFADFKDWTTKYKIATGREAKPMPEELKKAAEEVIRLTDEIKALELSIEEEARGLIEVEEIPEAAASKLKKLRVTRNRAISELERVKSKYDSLVAEWKHGLP